ncbi:MAG: phosphatase PAP2 family protein [Dysgonamonadaceae bacterium]|jgi:undecaprenyl-diphosphatase|nr:phosphatase PAP2 family protein [Dysgonamonadaceae bacterium]
MLEKELIFERDLFFALNGSDYGLLDNFFYLYTYKWTWVIFYLSFLLVFLGHKKWKEIVCAVLAIALLMLLCDQISSHVFKPLFHRFRPTNHPYFQNIVDVFHYGDYEYRGSGYGFISGHATNSMGFAIFTALVFRNRFYTVSILLFALIMGYSRIYLGRHFISDVVVGWAVGALIGYCVYKTYMYAREHWAKISPEKSMLVHSHRGASMLGAIFWLYIVILLLFNNQWIAFRFYNT